MIISKAPVRLSFGGGGTDLPAYYERHGGAVLSVTIDKFFYTVLEPVKDGPVEIVSSDYQLHQRFPDMAKANLSGALKIPKAVLKRYGVASGVYMALKGDVPTGSGLGLSGAVTVSIVQAVATFTGESHSKAELAEIASDVEIGMLGRPIGMQDQYAAAHGGLNYMTFTKDGVTVAPVTLPDGVLDALERRLLLFHTGAQRDSASILKGQKKSMEVSDASVIATLGVLKEQAARMRDLLSAGDLDGFGCMLDTAWNFKKSLAKNISNPDIDGYYAAAREAGALGGKITGAGGGGFLLLYCPLEAQADVVDAMTGMGLERLPFCFETTGAQLTLDHTGQFSATITPEGYLLGMRAVVSRLDKDKIGRIADMIWQAREEDRQIFIMGNGGSASTASHFCSDLSKTTLVPGKKGFRVVPLTDNIPLMTAWGNDAGFENIFYGQLINLLNPGDVVVGISGGGMSPNILKALDLARERGARTIGMSGFSGGKLKDAVEECFIVPSDNYQFIEDVHMILVHLIASVLRERMARE
ncbi:GHMP kinase [Solidesulfovibrio fructosivorans JJ]]|uniref:GHMP kinase n=1 Tax=Solidesulfovibrio fructosivorans JJ] TaxID=596151 RepID=E1JY75_SOLFR|nr:SIS domain-containing protein [Solidesulfovibrio fructosivorans]EFL50649.1 GHMP kinase [Solidesulfovibrio fructosivorans JJ]]